MTPTQAAALLSALSTEFADMGEAVETLSGVVLDHARLVPPADRARVLGQAQAIDLLSQRLAALRDLSIALSDGRSVDAVLDAVPLADMADRLRLAVVGAGPDRPAPRAAAGDLLLFD
jgi:hypothetical protein